MVWTPYTHLMIQDHVPFGLSSLCSHDEDYWLTKKLLVFDIYVDEYSPHHVMRQFRRFEAFPIINVRTVLPHVHR